MPQITGVAEAVLYVRDLDRTARFYTEVLGLRLTSAFDEARFLQVGPHSTLILFTVEGIKTRQSSIPDHGSEGSGHIAFGIPTEEMDIWRARLLAHDIEIEHEQDWPHGTHSIYFRDPDGNSVELIDDRHYPLIWENVDR